MRLTMLGTGGALVTDCYNTCIALEENGSVFITDCGGGNGILRQLEAARIDAGSIRQVFITHRHQPTDTQLAGKSSAKKPRGSRASALSTT